MYEYDVIHLRVMQFNDLYDNWLNVSTVSIVNALTFSIPH